MNLGPAEIVVILLIGLLVFGPSRLPELSRQVGGAMRELRKMQSSLKREINEAMSDDPPPMKPRTATTAKKAEPDHTDLPALGAAASDMTPPDAAPSADAAPAAAPDPVDDGFAGPNSFS